MPKKLVKSDPAIFTGSKNGCSQKEKENLLKVKKPPILNQIAVQGSQIKGNFNLFTVCWESIWIEHESLDFLNPSDSHLGPNWRFPFQIPSQRTDFPSALKSLTQETTFWA